MNIEFFEKFRSGSGLEIEVRKGTEILGYIRKHIWRFAFYKGNSEHALLVDEDMDFLKKMVKAKYGDSIKSVSPPLTKIYSS